MRAQLLINSFPLHYVKEGRGVENKVVSEMMRTLLLASMLALAFNIRVVNAESDSTWVRVEPANILNPSEKTFKVNVTIADVSDLYGWQFYLEWKATLLDFVNVTEGSFLKENTPSPEGTLFVYVVEQDDADMDHIFPGCVTQGIYLGVSGSGTLATITFRVGEVTGETPLHLYNVKLRDHFGEPIEPTSGPPGYYFTNLEDGFFRLRIPGDVNGDGVVDIVDLAAVAWSFGTEPDDPNWNPDADLNNDNLIDIDDLIIVGLNYGKRM